MGVWYCSSIVVKWWVLSGVMEVSQSQGLLVRDGADMLFSYQQSAGV